MAEKDIAEKTFMSLNDVFADVFNVLVFQGEHVVKEEELVDGSSRSQYKADDGMLHEQERDTCKLWQRNRMNLVFAGIENQTEPETLSSSILQLLRKKQHLSPSKYPSTRNITKTKYSSIRHSTKRKYPSLYFLYNSIHLYCYLVKNNGIIIHIAWR